MQLAWPYAGDPGWPDMRLCYRLGVRKGGLQSVKIEVAKETVFAGVGSYFRK